MKVSPIVLQKNSSCHIPVIENGTRIKICTFSRIDGFYVPEDLNVILPNFAEWSAKEQFDLELSNSDTIAGERPPLINVERGFVMAYA